MLKINWGTTYLNYCKTIDIGEGIPCDLKKKKKRKKMDFPTSFEWIQSKTKTKKQKQKKRFFNEAFYYIT